MIRGTSLCPSWVVAKFFPDRLALYRYLAGDPVLFKFAKESGLGDAKLLSGLGHVVAKPGERFDDGRSFQFS